MFRHQSKAHGHGVHIWKNGDRYEGEWRDCLKHGKGTDVFASGDMYVGDYYKGKPTGEGTYKWKNGALYKGQFKNGLKHGKGKWVKDVNKPGANNYEGEYFMDKKHGYGVFKWESGNVYKGHYKEDQRHGYGEMYWTDGSVYKGDWVKGIQHGFGEMIFPDGTKKTGIFDHNTFVTSTVIPDTVQEETKDSRLSKRNMSYDKPAPHKFITPSHSRRTSINDDRRNIVTANHSKYIDHKYNEKGFKFFSPRGRSKASPKQLPPIASRVVATTHGSRKTSSLDKMNKTGSDFSFVDENVKSYALNVMNRRRGRSKKLSNKKPIWRPTGNVQRRDGYSVIQKMYY